MDAASGRAYDDFKPPHKMQREPPTHVLSVDLSAKGYKKEHIKVQLVRSCRLLVVRGECPVAGNRWSRFRLELPVPGGCDVKAIHARFENGVVRVIMPGMNEPEMPAAKTGAEAVAGQAPTDATAKEGGREGPDAVGDHHQQLDEVAPCGGYRFLRERKKLATTLLGVVLVLFSFVIYVRYSVKP